MNPLLNNLPIGLQTFSEIRKNDCLYMGQKKRKEPRVWGSFLFASTKIIHFRAKCKSL